MTGRQTPIKAKADFDAIGDLLRQYGMDLIDSPTFWRIMKARGWGQDDIDRWCEMNGAPAIAGARHEQPMIDVTPLIGVQVQLGRTIDVPCAMCGHTAVVVGPGTGPHVASLNCIGCGRHRGWLPKTVADFLLELITRFGRPSETIKIRNPQIRESECAIAAAQKSAP